MAALVAIVGAARPWEVAAARATSVEVSGPAGDTLASVTPTFTVVARGFPEQGCALRIELQLSSRADFATSLARVPACGDSLTVTLARPLPDRVPIYWRAVAAAASGSDTSAVTGPRVTAHWLTLVSPNAPNGATLATARPVFTWRSAQVATPPGPWIYTLTITNVNTRHALAFDGLLDTTFTPPSDLEVNTSYRWSVTARLTSGDSTRAASLSSFVITDRTVPLLTLLYQNWPNPFPSAGNARTCAWVDLAHSGIVRLDVYDLRGMHVRTLIPGPHVAGLLSAGRYGRATPGSDSGCDPDFSWDGTDDAGRTVAPGVYLLRLRADGESSVRRMLFRGRQD